MRRGSTDRNPVRREETVFIEGGDVLVTTKSRTKLVSELSQIKQSGSELFAWEKHRILVQIRVIEN